LEYAMDPAFEVTETRIPAATHDRPSVERSALTGSIESPPGGFPKSIHGYNVGAVDDYLRKLNSRLESLLSQVQSESSRADQSKRLLEQMTAELDTMRRRASDAEKREITAIEGQRLAQEEVAKLSQELKEVRENTRMELERALADVRQERDSLIAEERQDAEALIAEARKAAAAQIEDIRLCVERLQAEVARLTAELEARPAQAGASGHTDSDGSGLPNAAGDRAHLEVELEAQRIYAREQIELVLSEARTSVEKATEHSVAAFQEQEKRVRALGDECEALVARMKEAIDTQLLPAASVRPTPAVRAPVRNDESEEKRVRESRDWRSGDWRSAS
jgi:cell division septum initiation protein DivIVA